MADRRLLKADHIVAAPPQFAGRAEPEKPSADNDDLGPAAVIAAGPHDRRLPAAQVDWPGVDDLAARNHVHPLVIGHGRVDMSRNQ
jgi:hypothetical protein